MREISVEISGTADTGCNVEKVFKARILENKNKETAYHKENQVGEDSTQGLGSGLPSIGPQVILGQTEANKGLVEPRAPLSQAKEIQLFQIGPKKSGAIERGSNKRAKSPTQKKPHAHAIKSGKENVGLCTSNLLKVNAMEEIT